MASLAGGPISPSAEAAMYAMCGSSRRSMSFGTAAPASDARFSSAKAA